MISCVYGMMQAYEDRHHRSSNDMVADVVLSRKYDASIRLLHILIGGLLVSGVAAFTTVSDIADKSRRRDM